MKLISGEIEELFLQFAVINKIAIRTVEQIFEHCRPTTNFYNSCDLN